jgi:hypothetical protein
MQRATRGGQGKCGKDRKKKEKKWEGGFFDF